jgi:acetoin utilization protein AcuB
MKVGEWMAREVVTVNKEQSIQQCSDLMKAHSIRHLPVVKDGKLEGFITEGDIRQVLLASMIEELTIEDVMISNPITAAPDTDIEEAAKIIYYNKIGGLPVVDEEDYLVGIITVADIMASFIELMGVLRSSSRIDVILGDDPEAYPGID